ncbi:hypothetical protein [Phyllobacterium sp. 22552]|uniref:hypothetical protein n=1 Tax=Phyllobacterium sp. 22552 TaxID=3453941 RepID=UPI003F859ABC
MMPIEHNDRQYSYIMGSDGDRDGMYIEVIEDGDQNRIVLEIFYSDITHEMTLVNTKPDVPLAVVEWAIAVAKERLPPTIMPKD